MVDKNGPTSALPQISRAVRVYCQQAQIPKRLEVGRSGASSGGSTPSALRMLSSPPVKFHNAVPSVAKPGSDSAIS